MLQPNQRLTINGKPYVVQYVNLTGAWVVPVEKQIVVIKDRRFEVTPHGTLISADSQPS